MSESIPPNTPPTEPLPDDDIPLTPSTGPASPPLPSITSLPYKAPTSEFAWTGTPPTKDEQNMGMLAHLLGIFTGFLGPLILWLIKKDESKYIDEQSKEALNFQIAALIVILACLPFIFIPFLGFCLAPLLSVAAHITRIVFSVIGTVSASKGEMYRYPFTYRFIK